MRILTLAFLLFTNPLAAAAEPLKICSDNGYWFPYIWLEDGEIRGLHIRIIRSALEELEIDHEFQARPWKRCLLYAQSGQVDAIATASFSYERNDYLHYPPDAAPDSFSKWQIGIARYVVISHMSDPFRFNGDLRKLPGPVRAVLGYSIVHDLEQAGLEVFQDKNPLTMYRSLLQSKQGVIVGFEALAEKINETDPHHGQLRIHQPAVKSKSYYLPISRKAQLDEARRMQIWEKVARAATNVKLVNGFFDDLKLDSEAP